MQETIVPPDLRQTVSAAKTAALLDVTVRTIGNWLAAGKFPRPILVGGPKRHSRRWRLADIEEFIAKRDTVASNDAGDGTPAM
jgi:predicted DNA-binding transcriptional regulator AlpA